MTESKNENGHKKRTAWSIQKEKILMFCGLILIGYESIVSSIIGQPFHFEILLAGLALCGISLTQWGDKQL